MPTQPQSLPISDDFRFQWDSPEEAARFWTVDLMHYPHGVSPLSATMDLPAFYRGMNKAAQALCMPFTSRTKIIRGYVYMSPTPYSADPKQMHARVQQMQAKMSEHIPGLLGRWYNRYEPEVRSINDETLKGDYSKLGDGDLAHLLEVLVEKREREGELHFLAVFPAMDAVRSYERLYSELFGEPTAEEHLLLLQGFPNKSIEVGVALWHLALEARRRPTVLGLLQRLAPSAADTALTESAEGRAFRAAVWEFLNKYGWRGSEIDLVSPTWFEDPTPVYRLIRDYASRHDYDPEDELKSLVAARESRKRALIGRLSGDNEAASRFERILAGAQQYLPIQEDHNFWIDQQGLSVQRIPVLEAGRRLTAARRLADPTDVFYLEYGELQDALRGGKGDLLELAAQRRRQRAEDLKATPPPTLGTPPPNAERSSLGNRFSGALPPESADLRLIPGNRGSMGKVTGTARVILSLDEAERLKAGEILVCPATMPAWTPLFAIASGIVTDHGGVLSHTAIVAREYQIPAVVGTKIGTTIIRDGQRITVDGDAGTVMLED